MPDLADLCRLRFTLDSSTSVAHLARSGGEGPPVLLLHGYPQSHLMWRAVAPLLADRHTSSPPTSLATATRSTRRDGGSRRAQQACDGARPGRGHGGSGFDRFAVVGHDRGGRVAYRMALDHPATVERLAVLDIVPTWAMWRRMDAAPRQPRLALDVSGAASAPFRRR